MESMSWQNGNLSVVSYERLLKLFHGLVPVRAEGA
jgi:hypothetical protein